MPTLAGLRRRGVPPGAIAISSRASASPKANRRGRPNMLRLLDPRGAYKTAIAADGGDTPAKV